MRAIAACQFTLSRFGTWRFAVSALTACVVLCLSLWLIEQPAALHRLAAAAVCAAGAAVLALCASLLRIKAVTLRWDGQAWFVGRAGAPDHHAVGTLSVSLDLGAWMLLRFQARALRGGGPVIWLPVQRRGLEAQWHALRCAVYSPRLAGGADAAAGP